MIICYKWNLSMIVYYSYLDLNYYDFLIFDDQIISIFYVYVWIFFYVNVYIIVIFKICFQNNVQIQ